MKFKMINILSLMLLAIVTGCQTGGIGDYSNQWLYPDNVSTVYVEMFDTGSYRRGYEYVLTDAICKRLESATPYKIVTDRDIADTILSGKMDIYTGELARERYTGRSLEKEAVVAVSVSWKNLRNGKLLINNETVTASASYSPMVNQTFDYSAGVAVNRAAERVIELMETAW